MKCEICGEQISVLGVFEARLCDKHAEQVRDYIKSLKPKVSVGRDDDVYALAHRDKDGVMCVKTLCDAEADALYEYMKAEKAPESYQDRVAFDIT